MSYAYGRKQRRRYGLGQTIGGYANCRTGPDIVPCADPNMRCREVAVGVRECTPDCSDSIECEQGYV